MDTDGNLWTQSKTVTITAVCTTCTNTYSVDGGTTWSDFPSNSFSIKFISERIISTKSSDGTNIVSNTYTVTNIDSTPAGIIKINAGSTPPGGYLLCNGQAVSRTTYANLFKVIGTTYGAGDGSTTFNVPNLNGRVVVGKSSSTFTTLGQTGGEINSTLTTSNLPAHTHTVTPKGTVSSSFTGSSVTTSSSGAHTHTLTAYFQNSSSYLLAKETNNLGFRGSEGYVAKATSSNGTHTHTVIAKGTVYSTFSGSATSTSSIGNGSSFTNLQPYIVENYIIKY